MEKTAFRQLTTAGHPTSAPNFLKGQETMDEATHTMPRNPFPSRNGHASSPTGAVNGSAGMTPHELLRLQSEELQAMQERQMQLSQQVHYLRSGAFDAHNAVKAFDALAPTLEALTPFIELIVQEGTDLIVRKNADGCRFDFTLTIEDAGN